MRPTAAYRTCSTTSCPIEDPACCGSVEVVLHQSLARLICLTTPNELAPAKNGGMIGQAEGSRDELLDDDHRHTEGQRRAQRLEDLLDDDRSQPVGELVDDEQFRRDDEHSGQRQHLLLAT